MGLDFPFNFPAFSDNAHATSCASFPRVNDEKYQAPRFMIGWVALVLMFGPHSGKDGDSGP